MDSLPPTQGELQRSRLRCDGPSATKGFTLLEVVISVAILAVILTIVYNAFNSSMKAFSAMETQGDAYAQARAVLNRICGEIGSAYWSADNRNTGLIGADDEVDDLPSDSLHFTSCSHFRWAKDSRESELCEIGYYLEKDAETEESFLFRREDWNVDETLEEGGRPLELAEGADGLNFRYYDGQEWADDWDSRIKGGLPQAIEVVLIMRDPRRTRIAFSSIIPIPTAGR